MVSDVDALALIDEASTLIATLDPDTLTDTDLLACLGALHAHTQRATATTLALLHTAKARNLPSSAGAAHPLPWTAGTLKISRTTARGLHRLDQALTTAPLIADAFRTGRITSEQAQLMADTTAVLPTGTEHLILARGADLAPDELRVVLREVQEELDPAGTQQRDEDTAARAEQRAHERRRVSLSRLDGSNLIRIDGYLDITAAASFLTAVDTLCAPQNRTALGLTNLTDGEPDLRTAGQRRHDAICEIGNRVQATGTLPDHGGDRPQTVVTVDYDTLIDDLGGLGHLDDGTPLTPAACRQAACDAHILPAILNGASLPLDLGRSHRTFNATIRRALKLRDRGCAFPRCNRGPAWTQAHHCRPWYLGGSSDLTNAVLTCARHHRLLHHTTWRVQINPNDSLPDFYAPGDNQAQRNHYHRRP